MSSPATLKEALTVGSSLVTLSRGNGDYIDETEPESVIVFDPVTGELLQEVANYFTIIGVS